MAGQFLLFQSNSLTALAKQFAASQNRTRSNPLNPESVIIQTTGMETWLTQQCTRENDIFAAIEYIRPAKYLLRLNAKLTGESEERTVFEPENMRWFIYREIEENPRRYPLVEEYLAGEDGAVRQQKLFTFASEVAELFDSYILYRPDILESWERDEYAADAVGNERFTGQTRKHEQWQKLLWQKMISYHNDKVANDETNSSGQNPVEVLSNLAKILSDSNLSEELKARLTAIDTIALFGMSVLPTRYMELFKLLSLHCQVELYVINPSQFYWGDVLTDRHVSFRRKQLSGENLEHEYLLMGNRLLRNLGEAGRDFFHSLYETAEQVNIHEMELFEELEPDTLLHAIQNDILTWEDNDREEPLELPGDNSLTINRCYTPLREVEVLYDYLLGQFEQDDSLTMGDILIITPDIETYAPLISMVFSRNSKLYGAIADRSALAVQSELQLVKEILSLPESRYAAPDVVSLFEQYARFTNGELSIREEEMVQKWISECGIRWGTDSAFWFRRTGSDFGDERFNWQSGLERMFQGYAGGEIQFEIPSYNEIEGSDAELLGRIAAFVRTVGRLEELSRRKASVEEWSRIFSGWFRELFLYDEGEHEDGSQPVLSEIIKQVNRLSEQVAVTKDDGERLEVSFGTIRSALMRQLEEEESGGGFLRGAITFASTMPLRSIPFRLVGAIGMNHNTFPRVGTARSFNLMQAEKRRGDRDTRQNDLYLFLETVISAGDRFYVSATAFNEKSGEQQPVSSVVEQLITYIEENYRFDGESPLKRIATVHPLHPFSQRYLTETSLFTYQERWFPQEMPAPLFEDSLMHRRFDSVVDSITLPSLLKWLVNPLEDLFSNLVGMEFPEQKTELPGEEPFELNSLRRHMLRDAGIRSILTGEDEFRVSEKELYYQGELPTGASLNLALEEVQEEIESFRRRIPETLGEERQFSVEGEVGLVGYHLESFPLYENGNELILVDAGNFYRSGKKMVDLKRLFKLWLSYLIVNCSEEFTVKLITRDTTIWYPGIASVQARHTLERVVSLYLDSRKEFVPYFGKASYVQFREKGAVHSILEKQVEDTGFNFVDFHESLFMKQCGHQFTQEIEERTGEIAESLFGAVATWLASK